MLLIFIGITGDYYYDYSWFSLVGVVIFTRDAFGFH